MNKRIQELAEQSGFISESVILGPKLEKFAELIVSRCGYYADIFAAAGCPVDMDPTETKPSDYIKKHFGAKL